MLKLIINTEIKKKILSNSNENSNTRDAGVLVYYRTYTKSLETLQIYVGGSEKLW